MNVRQRMQDWKIVFYISMCVCVVSHFSHVWLFATFQTVARQALLSMGFSRQEYWSGLHFLLQRTFPTQGSNARLLRFLHWQVASLPLYHWEALYGAVQCLSFVWNKQKSQFCCSLAGQLGSNLWVSENTSSFSSQSERGNIWILQFSLLHAQHIKKQK